MHTLMLGSTYNICLALCSLFVAIAKGQQDGEKNELAVAIGIVSFAIAMFSLYGLIVRAQKVILHRASIHPVGKRLCFLCFLGAGDLERPVRYKEESMVTWEPADYDVDRVTNVSAQVAAKIEDAELRERFVTDSYGAPRVAWAALGGYYEAKFGDVVAAEEREHMIVEALPNGKRFVTLRGMLALGQLRGENAAKVAAASKPKDDRSTGAKLAVFCRGQCAGAIRGVLLETVRYPLKLMIVLFYVCVALYHAVAFSVCGFPTRRKIRDAIARGIDREDLEEGGAVALRNEREREMLALFGLLDEERLYHCGVFRQSYVYHIKLENLLNVTIMTQLLLVNDAVLPNSAFFNFPLTLAQPRWNRGKARLVAKLAELRASIDAYMVEYHRDELDIRYAGDVLAFQRTKSGLYGLMIVEGKSPTSGGSAFGASPRRPSARRGPRVKHEELEEREIEWTQGGEEVRGSWAQLKANILDRDVTASDTIRVEGIVKKWTKVAEIESIAALVPADWSPALYDKGRDQAPPSPAKKAPKKKRSFSAPPVSRDDFQGLDIFWTDRGGAEHAPSTWSEYKAALCDGDVGFESTVRAPPVLVDSTKVKNVPALAPLGPAPPAPPPPPGKICPPPPLPDSVQVPPQSATSAPESAILYLSDYPLASDTNLNK